VTAHIGRSRLLVKYDDEEELETRWPRNDLELLPPRKCPCSASNPRGGDWTDGSGSDDEREAELSEYERQRLRNIARNGALLKQLGLSQSQ
jgi:hypothetical protein